MLGRTFDLIAVVVTIVWAASVIVGVVDPSRQANPAAYALMTAIIGAYAGARVIARNGGSSPRRNGNGNGSNGGGSNG